MRANELQGCQTAKIAAASKQCSLSRRHMWGFIFKTSGSFFFYYSSKPYSNGLTNFKRCERNVLGTFALDCCDHQGVRKIYNCNAWPLKKAMGGILF